MRSHHRTATVIFAVVALLAIAAPATAASPWLTFKQAGTSAFASDNDCTANTDGTVTCEGHFLSVFEGTIKEAGQATRKGDQICYSEQSSTFDPTTGEPVDSRSLFGCALDAGTLTIDDLTSITLAATTIPMTSVECDPTTCTESPAASITVSAAWTGVGPTFSQKSRAMFDDGICLQAHADKGTFRQAIFAGPFEALEAGRSEGTFTFRTTCAI